MAIVSVIIPTYNRAEDLMRCLKSVLAQTYKDYEIIIVDDGSSDNTRELVANIEGPIQYIYQQNQGPAGARNTGIKCAKGEYIAFIDDDTIWHPEKLEIQMAYFTENSDIGIVKCQEDAINSINNYVTAVIERSKIRTQIKSKLQVFRSPNLFPPSVIIKKFLLEKVNYFDAKFTPRAAEDTDLFLRLSDITTVLEIDARLVFLYEHDRHISLGVEPYFDRIRVYERYLSERPDLKTLYAKAIKEIYCNTCMCTAREYFTIHDAVSARKYFLKALSYRWDLVAVYLYLKSFYLQLNGYKGVDDR